MTPSPERPLNAGFSGRSARFVHRASSTVDRLEAAATTNDQRFTINEKRTNGAIMIGLQGVTKTYETAAGPFPALRGIDLEIGAGEFVAIVGKSGSGKSTLLNLLGGIDAPTSGSLLVGRTAVQRLSEGELAAWRGRHGGFVFPVFLLPPTPPAGGERNVAAGLFPQK